MRRYVAYAALILLLAPVESSLPCIPVLHGVHLLLLVPLVFFLALEVGTVEGLILSYVAGLTEDAMSSYTTCLAAVSFVVLFIVARVALVAVRTDGPAFEAFFCFLLAAGFFALTFGLRRAFEPGQSLMSDNWWGPYVSACAATAVAAPFVAAVGRRIEKLQVKSPGAL